MGKKKGKKQDESWGDSPDVPPETTTTGAVVAGSQKQIGGAVGGGKKGKKKKDIDEDDIEADLLAIASEQDIKQESTETPPTYHTPSETDKTSKGKKGKKSRKQDDWEDDVLQELEQLNSNEANQEDSSKETSQEDSSKEMAQGDSSKEPALKIDASSGSKKSKKGKKGKQDEQEVEKLLREIEGTELPSVSKPDVIEATPLDDDEEEEVHIKSKAEKKAAKKEREKKQKEQMKKQQQKTKSTDDKMSTDSTVNLSEAAIDQVSIDPPEAIIDPSKATVDPSKATVDLSEATVDLSEATVDPSEATVDPSEATGDPSEATGDLEDDNEDEKKKKKKKKKKTDKEDDKKAAKSKKVKSAVQKMKEEIEALRLAQKKREEEELLRLKAEEEAERQRQEKIRLEKERKEKKKLKEKERKERLKKEGKLVSKAEKERRLRTELQLQALEQQGIIIPQKTGLAEGEKKRPVRYGSRVRPKKPSAQPDDKIATPTEDNLSQVDEGVASISETTSVTEENVKDNWDDEDEEEVKDNWEDESEDDIISLDDKDKEEDHMIDHVIDHVTVTPPKEPDVIDVDVNEGSENSEESESSDSDDEDDDDNLSPYEKAAKRIKERQARHQNERSPDLLRSPVVCVLGHVDTGKTKILDKIRHTHVQDGEAGGITQQIGATFVPPDAILEQTKMMKEFQKAELQVPGLLIIDTPGHESFSNLRTRGSSMCDIAILVVDIMHGLEPQTIESLNLLRKGNVPFIVALNKIDRLYDWRRNPNSAVRENLKKQKPNTKEEFDERTKEVTLQFAEQGLNAGLFWERLDFTEYIPMVPTSAITGDGMGDLISLVVSHSEQHLVDQLMFSKEVEAIVLEVKVVAGLGTTIDVILRNGMLNEGDTFILMGSEGPFVTQARALLMPQPLRELRVKNAYVNHKTVIASQGVKICGKDLEKTLAGTPVLVAKHQDEVDVLKDESASTMSSALRAFKIVERGVFVQASTLGSLEALVEFLKTSKIPYAGVNIGPVHKKDVMKASVMLERDSQWACILAFDVRVEREAQEMADSIGVRIFTADIIYHLFDNFMKYREELKERRRREHEHIATFPCKVKILPNCVFNARNPIIVGVTVVAGIVKPGTPLVVPTKDFVNIGTISSIEINHKPVDIAHKGSEVCIKIEPASGEAPKLFGRHFDYDDLLVSKISRESIDAVKKYFREDLQKSDWQLMIELKKIFQIY